jgi:hypothetical protein
MDSDWMGYKYIISLSKGINSKQVMILCPPYGHAIFWKRQISNRETIFESFTAADPSRAGFRKVSLTNLMFPASVLLHATKKQKSTGQMRAIVSTLVNHL